MKLYYSPGACSLAVHIVAREAGIPIELERVDLVSKRYANADFSRINPKGYVPALQLDDGELLTEGPVISQYLADLVPQRQLLAPVGHRERYRVLSWLGFINSELHKRFSPLFQADFSVGERTRLLTELHARFALVDKTLQEQPWLGGQAFSIADAYLFVVASWARLVRLDLSPYGSLQAFQRRCAERPRVLESMCAEGLLASPVGDPGVAPASHRSSGRTRIRREPLAPRRAQPAPRKR